MLLTHGRNYPKDLFAFVARDKMLTATPQDRVETWLVSAYVHFVATTFGCSRPVFTWILRRLHVKQVLCACAAELSKATTWSIRNLSNRTASLKLPPAVLRQVRPVAVVDVLLYVNSLYITILAYCQCCTNFGRLGHAI